jgi:DNA polymerase III delta prime subunit
MTKVLKFVAKKERINLPEDTAEAIVLEAKGNMRKALLVFEALRMQRWVIFRHSNGAGSHTLTSRTT